MMTKISYGKNVYDKREINAVLKTLKNSTQMGKSVETFERKIAKLFSKKYGLMVNSGSSALILALKVMNFPRGSEIIAPCLNFGTAVSSIMLCNLNPIFVDCEIKTLQIDLSKIEKKISKKTKALLIPNLIGNIPDWKVINNCISVLNAPDFTLKSSGCYAYGADCAIKETCWAFGISSTTCNDPDSNSNIKIKVPSWKIKSSGSIIPVPDWWVSENSTSQISIPQFIRNEAVSGYHELALWTNMGSDELSNKGLFRSFTDRNVLDGIEYTYAVTSRYKCIYNEMYRL